MAELRGIEADFATWRPVQGRKVLQLVFEVPIEQTQHVLDMLGIPQPGGSKWCAIALLNTTPVAQRAAEATYNAKAKPVAERLADAGSSPAGIAISQAEGGHPKKWSEYPRSQQAAILCADPDFQRYWGQGLTEEQCACALRNHFHIQTRKDLELPTNHARWDEFVALYHLHRDRLR